MKKLTAAERIELSAVGAAKAVSRSFEEARRLRAERMRGRNKDLPGLIHRQAFPMVRSVRGKRFFSSHGAGVWLITRGLHEPVRYYNGFGCAMGLEGLKLPSFKFEGRRYFDLLCVGMTEKQKRERQRQISQLGVDLLHVLIAG